MAHNPRPESARARMGMRARLAPVLALAVLAFFAGAGCGPVRAAPLAGKPLVQHLRQGGYVLLMRHARSPAAPPDKGMAAPDNLKLERQLDETGRSTARAMGAAIRALHIPIGAVLSSPAYRALETIRYAALGSVKTHAELGDGGQSMRASAVSGQADWLRKRVAEPPKPGTNTVIVTHMPNIQAAFAQDAANLADGEALVFQPDGHGGAALVAKLKIEDWPGLASGK